MAKLTKRIADESKPGPKPYLVWDGEVRGFGLLVLPSNVKTYVLQYRNEARRSRRLTVGRHGTMTVDEARDFAREMAVKVAKGEDPVASRQCYRAAPTVSELLERYYEEHVLLHNAPSTQKDVRVVINNHLRPQLGSIKVNDLTRADASKMHVAMKSTPRRANQVLAIFSKSLSLAELWGYRTQHSNPCICIKRYPEHHRTRFLRHEEVQRLQVTLTEAETTGLPWNVAGNRSKHLAKEKNQRTVLTWQVVGIIGLLLLTGARLGEIISLKWTDVDRGLGTIALPKKKGGKREPYPSSDASFELLNTFPKYKHSIYVFPRDSDPARHITREVMESTWQRVRWRAQIEDVRMHDLRHTVGTYAAQAGVSGFIVRDLLRHTSIATTGRYANFDASPVRQVANVVGERITAAMKNGRS